jgi:hypothetical protein
MKDMSLKFLVKNESVMGEFCASKIHVLQSEPGYLCIWLLCFLRVEGIYLASWFQKFQSIMARRVWHSRTVSIMAANKKQVWGSTWTGYSPQGDATVTCLFKLCQVFNMWVCGGHFLFEPCNPTPVLLYDSQCKMHSVHLQKSPKSL